MGLIARGVIVHNGGHPRPGAPSHPFKVIAGSNACLDFSAYSEGLRELDMAADDGTAILFINDSLYRSHAGSLILRATLNTMELLKDLYCPSIAGKLDPYRSIMLTNPWSQAGHYVSTFCFLLNRQAIDIFSDMLEDAFAQGSVGDRFQLQPPWWRALSPSFREYIKAHLVHQTSDIHWRLATTGSGELRSKKALCLYLEHRLSGHVMSQGAVVPINTGIRNRLRIAFGEFLHILIHRGRNRTVRPAHV
jgi:hypothetical protein